MPGRNNTTVTIQASANSTDTTSGWIHNPACRGGLFQFHVTAASATAILPTWTVQGRVGNTTKAYNIASIATTSTASVNILAVYPGATTAGTEFGGSAAGSSGARGIVSLPLPNTFRVRSTNAGSGTVTWAGWVDLIS